MIARKSLLMFGNAVVGGLLGLLAIKLTATFLGRDVVNPVEFGLGVMGLLFFLTDFGFGAAHTKRVSEGMDEGDCLATFAYFKLFATAAFVLAGSAIVLVTLLRPGLLQDATPGVLLLVVAYYATKSVATIPGATFEAKRETARAQLGYLTDTAVRVLATALVALLFAGAVLQRGPFTGLVASTTPILGWLVRNPAAALAGAYFLGTAGSVAVMVLYARRFARWGRFRWEILRSYWSFAVHIAMVNAIAVVATNVDRAALGFFGASGEAALFGYARRLGMFVESIPVAVAALLFPTISLHHGRGELGEIARVREQALRYSSFLILPFLVVTSALAPAVVHLFLSNEWLPAAPAMPVLAIFSFTFALSVPYITFLTGTGQVREVSRIAAAAAVTNIVLAVLLIPGDLSAVGLPAVRLAGLGVMGAAIAVASNGVLAFLLYRRAAARKAPVHDAFLLKHLLAAAGMTLALGALHALLLGSLPWPLEPSIRWYHFGLIATGAGLAYLGILHALGEFGAEEIRYFLSLAHPGRMAGYVRKELTLSRK